MPLQFLEQISFAPIKVIAASDMLCVSVHKSQCEGMPSLHKNSISEHTQLRLSFVPTCPIGAKHCSAMHGYTSVLGSTTGVVSNWGKQVIVPRGLAYEPSDKPGNCRPGSPTGEDYTHVHRNTKWVDRFCETSHTDTNIPTQKYTSTNIPVRGNLSEEELEVVIDIFCSLRFGGRGEINQKSWVIIDVTV